MKRLLVAVLIGFIISMSGTAFAEKLFVGTDTAFVPFEYKGKDGKYTGFDIDLWAEIAKRIGVEYELKPMDFNGLIPGADPPGTSMLPWRRFSSNPPERRKLTFPTPISGPG